MVELNNERILIFGGTGSLGKSLLKRFKNNNEIGVFSRDESKHWTIKNEYGLNNGKNNEHRINKGLRFFVANIRDMEKVENVITNFDPTIIIIAAALKHVDICESFPEESIKTNILGPLNVVNAVEKNKDKLKCHTVVMVSTDKACEPLNVYGMCKSIAERIVTNKANSINSNKIKFVATRYGNVLESRGSILPLFKYQAENSDCLTLTHDKMTRFLMTLDQSVDLIVQSIVNGNSGELWIPKLKSMRIKDLAEIFAEIHNKPIKKIPIKPGEKLNETLVSYSESPRTIETEDHYILKSINTELEGVLNFFTYTSADNILEKNELRNYLRKLGIFDKELKEFVGKTIEEIRK